MSSASRMNSGVLPFEIDKELEDEFAKMKAESNTSFPVCPVPADPSPIRCTLLAAPRRELAAQRALIWLASSLCSTTSTPQPHCAWPPPGM